MKKHSIWLCAALLVVLARVLASCGMSGGTSAPFSPAPVPPAGPPTFTGTPTPSPTITNSPTITCTPTITNTPAAYLNGSVTYTGNLNGGSVNAEHPIGVEVYGNDALSAEAGQGIAGSAAVTVNGGAFSVPLETAGTYFVLVNYDCLGATTPLGCVDESGPLPGEPYALAVSPAVTTGSLPAPPVTVNAGSNSLGALTLNDSDIAGGVTGTINFKDSKKVAGRKEIHIQAYVSGTKHGTLLTGDKVAKSPGKYYLTCLGKNAGVSLDLVVFYDAVGGAPLTAVPLLNDPVTLINNVPTTLNGPGKPRNLSIDFH